MGMTMHIDIVTYLFQKAKPMIQNEIVKFMCEISNLEHEKLIGIS